MVPRQALALLFACNYFAFQLEPFGGEYISNHPASSDGCSFSTPATNWETFDKHNAPKAFVIDAGLRILPLFPCLPERLPLLHPQIPQPIVRDKSPPSSLTF